MSSTNSTESSSALEVTGLEVRIASTLVARELELGVARGETLAILGRNGVGKSTLLKTLAGLHSPHRGRVCLDGVPLERLAPRRLAQARGYLPQQSVDPFSSTVMETVLIGRHPHLGRWEWESPADHRLAREALASVGLAGFEARDVQTLSGGERQRLGLATLLVQAPRLFFLDEPLAHLDPGHGITALCLMRAEAGKATRAAIVMVLHDANLARRWCDRALLLFGDGAWAEGPVAEVVSLENVSRLYGHHFRTIDDGGEAWLVPT
jgi:iron complex transport system ATP-binding protein